MKIVRYILFCILVLIISILLRKPPDMSEGKRGFGNWAIVDWVTGFFSGGDAPDTAIGDKKTTDRVGGDEEDDEE